MPKVLRIAETSGKIGKDDVGFSGDVFFDGATGCNTSEGRRRK